MMWWIADGSSRGFPASPEKWPADAPLAVGGDLTPERLMAAYRQGIFAWYDEGWPVLWWSPDPRAIFELDSLHVSRRLARTLRSERFQYSIDRAFDRVIRGCSVRPQTGTWITPEMIAAYRRLHREGVAHSIEVWQDGELAGGLYGVAIGGLFAGESMFFRRRDASKAGLVYLVNHLRDRGFALFDTQMLTPLTVGMGAIEVPRSVYLRRLADALTAPTSFL